MHKQARRILPSFQSPASEQWLVKELDEFRGVVSNNDSMMHPIFRKAVREASETSAARSHMAAGPKKRR